MAPFICPWSCTGMDWIGSVEVCVANCCWLAFIFISSFHNRKETGSCRLHGVYINLVRSFISKYSRTIVLPPILPVARANIAGYLRINVCSEKLELQPNISYHGNQ